MRYFSYILIILALSVLSGCDSASERAQKHFETGVELAEAGDASRAMVEMRNVLQLDPDHSDARRLLADLLLEDGNVGQAAGHYVSLTERNPDDGEAHLAVAEIALHSGDWTGTRRHGDAANELLPESIRTRVIKANLDYRDALENEDKDKAAMAIDEARALVDEEPGLLDARRIVINDLLQQEAWSEALETIEAGIVQDSEDLELGQMRLAVLNELGRTPDITSQLETMAEKHSEQRQITQTLVRWYVAQGEVEAAEAFLRKRAENAPEDLERWMDLLRFLSELRGNEVVAEELDQLIAAGGDNIINYKAMRAALAFESGERDLAIADLEALLEELPKGEDADPEKSGTVNDVRVDLSRMHVLTGNNIRARELVDETLQNDPNHTAALKLMASWQIDDDLVEDAIVTLRAALRESPRDPQLMTLMASAHERAGESELQREMLALAVEASGGAPDESLRYAANLATAERFRPAEDTLVASLRLTPNDVRLLTALGNLYVATSDWSRADQVRATLEKLGEPGEIAAAELQARLLAGQQLDSELVGYLESLSEGDNALGAQIALIRTHASNNEMDKARERLDQAKLDFPGNEALRFIDAAIKASTGDTAAANEEFESLLKDIPSARRVWMALYRLKSLEGDTGAASEVLDRALAQLPGDPEFLITRAGVLERSGDVDGAIAIYEDLYQRNSSSEIVANNLASLLSTYRQDEETLEKAYKIGRRLQDSQVPAFRETYGWIAARLGRYEEAVEHLSIAAKAYPELALAQYHYAVALAGLGNNAEALEAFRHTATLDLESLPDADREAVKTEITRLEQVAAE